MPNKIITTDCPECSGTGFNLEHDPYDPHIAGECRNCPIRVECEACKGNGKIELVEVEVPEKWCGSCRHIGITVVHETKSVFVKCEPFGYKQHGTQDCPCNGKHWQGKTKTAWVVRA